MSQDSWQAAQVRWLGAAQLVAVVRSEPGITRAAAAQQLGIGSGGATELVARMRRSAFSRRHPHRCRAADGRRRCSDPIPTGPLVLAVELRAADWRLAWRASTVRRRWSLSKDM